MEYVYCIIRIFLVLLLHCYVPKIHFFTDIFIGYEDNNLYNINCVLQLNRSHACVEAMKSMKLSEV